MPTKKAAPKGASLPEGYSIEKAKEGAFKGRYIVRRNGERLANCGSKREAERAVQWYVERAKK